MRRWTARRLAFGGPELGFLSSAQRGLVFQDLALAEADDPVEFLDAAIEDVGQGSSAAAEAEALAGVSSRCAPDLFSQVGQDRIRSFGRPHIVADRTSGVGVGRTPCLATAARAAVRRSVR